MKFCCASNAAIKKMSKSQEKNQLSWQNIFKDLIFLRLLKSDFLSASMYTLVSSANKMGNKTFETLAKSFMYNIKSKWPKMLPCGTPHVIDFI